MIRSVYDYTEWCSTKSHVLLAAGRLFVSAQLTEHSSHIEYAELSRVAGLFGYYKPKHCGNSQPRISFLSLLEKRPALSQ